MASSLYLNLESHVKKLLSKAEIGFKNNKQDYISFLTYLIVTNNHKKLIWGIDISLQLLLSEPEKFWLSSNPEYFDPKEAELKRNLIRFIILKELDCYLNNNPIFLEKNEFLKQFIINQNRQLAEKINIDDLNTIFDHNMDFTIPRIENNKIGHYKNSLTYAFSVALSTLGVSAGYRFGWDYINFVLQKENMQYNELSRFNRRATHFIASDFIFLTTGLVFLMGYKFFDKAMSLILDHVSTWEKIELPDFIHYCSQENTDLKIKSKTDNVDNFWFEKSHLSNYEGKAPVMFRMYMHAELNRLQEGMDLKEFCKLLACSIVEIPNHLKDISYPLPIDILRNPQPCWTVNTRLKKKDCHELLQNYAKLAIVDHLMTELKSKEILEPAQLRLLEKFLITQSQQIKTKINNQNSVELIDSSSKDFEFFIKEIFIALIIFITRTAIFQYKIVNQDINPPNILLSIVNGVLLSQYGLVITTATMHSIVNKSLKLFSQYKENKTASKLQFFTTNTIKGSEELQAIFKEDFSNETEYKKSS